MRERTRCRAASAAAFILIPITAIVLSAGQRQTSRPAIGASDCTYLENPTKFRFNADDAYAQQSAITAKVASRVNTFSMAERTLDANAVPRKNFIDDAIFGRMAAAQIQSAPTATDSEFLRRAMLDLTGRIPSPDDLNKFLADSDPSK